MEITIKTYLTLHKIYDSTPETKPYSINECDRFIPFIKSFKYLSLMIDYMLDDTIDILARIKNANKAIDALKFIWDTDKASLETKIYLYLSIPINLVLWNTKI